MAIVNRAGGRLLNALGRGSVYLGLLGLASLGAYRHVLRRSLPRLAGVEHVGGLQGAVEVVRDRWAVPHIYATNLPDLFFAQGYVHAQDRLWQMEFQRRVGSGRLSELVGRAGLETDRFMRRVGMRRVAEREAGLLEGEQRIALESYAQGVNAYIQTPGRRFGLEFTLLRSRPEPWSPTDSLVWGKVLAWGLATNWDTELLRAKVVQYLGADVACLLEPAYPGDHPCVVPSDLRAPVSAERWVAEYERVRRVIGLGLPGAGSNNWVVGGARTATGRPLLANDPHLPPQAPAFWYEVHLSAPDLDAIGASIPGAPGVVIGHNRRIAWGVTNACVDVQDLYLEQRHPDDPTLYMFQDQWERAEVVREEIKVRGRRLSVVEEAHITRHGPLLSPFGHSQPDPQPVSLRWTGLQPGGLVPAVLAINRAGNWDEFREGLKLWTDPAQNFVYADVDGNIGYHLAGRVPIRARGLGLFPSPGWSGKDEWTGYIPFEELPHVLNSESGMIVTANNRIADGEEHAFVIGEWLNGYRAQRISDLLNARSHVSVQDCCGIQADVYSLPGVQLAHHLAKITPRDPIEERAKALLATWDGCLRPDSPAASMYEACLTHLQRRVLGPALGPLLDEYLGSSGLTAVPTNSFLSRSTPLLLGKLEANDEDWLHAVLKAGDVPELSSTTWETLLRDAWRDAVEDLRRRLGNDPSRWLWGRLHRVTFAHQLGRLRPLDRVLSLGPFPVGGDVDTVHNGAFLPRDGYSPVVGTVSYRQVVDLADLDRSVMGTAPGQSGQPGSPHYADRIMDWLDVRPHPMLFSREKVLPEAAWTLCLKPPLGPLSAHREG